MYNSTNEAAKKLGYADGAVIRRLIAEKKIKAIKIGERWVVTDEEIAKYKKGQK